MEPEKKDIEKPKKVEPKKIDNKVSIMFKENRKFDLHVGRNMITFKGRQKKIVPKDWLQHKDFKQVAKYFIVKGV